MFLSRPDEKRLWFTIASLLGVAVVLMFASLQHPWYTANYYVGETVEYRGSFDFGGATLRQFSGGQEGDQRQVTYDEDSPFGGLMDRTEALVGFGIALGVLYAVLLGCYYYGYISNPRWIKGAWILSFATLIGGIAYFTLNAGTAVSEQVLALLRQYPQLNAANFGPPDPRFWGAQLYGNGTLETAPGPGWLLAILAVLDLAVATVLLYRFPEPQQDAAESFAVDDDGAAQTTEIVERTQTAG